MSTINELHVNGQGRPIHADAERSLLSVLRDDLDLTGTKYGCGEGRCGACTVLLDGEPAHSCTTRVGSVRGRKITTIEGVAKNGKLHPLQEAFIEVDAMQCAYCTSGMIGLPKRTVAMSPEESERSHPGIYRAGDENLMRARVPSAA